MPVTDTVTTRTDARRRDRYAARSVLWSVSELARVKACGARSYNPAGSVGVKAAPGARAGFSGLQSCGSVWACPVCSAKIAATRQGDIASVVKAWQATGGRVGQLTLTMRHTSGQRLKTLWDGLAYGWGRGVTTGRPWTNDQAAYGIAGWCRVVEVTHGCSGWHVHIHALIFMAPESLLPAEYLGAVLFQRWADALRRKGFASPLAGSGGLDWKILEGDASNLGDYFTKAVYSTSDRAGLEVARGDLKEGRACGRCHKTHRQPFAILAGLVHLVQTGEIRDDDQLGDMDTWGEWERASKGRRQLTWSRNGFRESMLGDAPELSDDEIAAQEVGGDLVVMLPASSWARLLSLCAECRVLEAFERSVAEGLAVLDALGLPYDRPTIT